MSLAVEHGDRAKNRYLMRSTSEKDLVELDSRLLTKVDCP
jgi:hypothetical protein